MAVLGRACLIIAFAVTLYGISAALYGTRSGQRRWADSARRAVYALAALLTGAFVILEGAFLSSDFSFSVVAGHSSTTTPTLYRAAAAWSSQQGSLLLWAWLLSLWSSLVLYLTRNRLREITPWATAVLMGFASFFVGLVVFAESPFHSLARAPAEGVGLNPLLRYPSMMIHPPMLYSGYTLCAVPMAFGIGALMARRVDAEWIAATRRFALAAWLFLGIGIVLGARWSYVELGWGGYWGWDPVENASLMPWLICTAFIHSIMIQEKRGMLRMWNASLCLATGTLAIVGTFLVRSGIIDSIHAFVEQGNTIAWSFTALIATCTVGSIALVYSRRAILKSEHRLDSLLSREALFLFNNLLLVALCFVVFWGTFFPLISEALTGNKQTLGPPWFARYTVPLAIVLAIVSGLGPVISWRRATWSNLRRNLLAPLTFTGVTFVAVLAFTGAGHKPLAVAMFCAGAFVVACVGQEFWRGTKARKAISGERLPHALVSLVARNRRRYGGYLVHLGVAVLFIGIAASSAFQRSITPTLSPGQSTRVGGYVVRYARPTASITTAHGRLEHINLGSDVRVYRDGRFVTAMHTERDYFPTAGTGGPVSQYFTGNQTSEVGLQAGLLHDIWIDVNDTNVGSLMPIIRKGDRVFSNASALPPAMSNALLGQALTGIVAHYKRFPPPVQFRMLVSPMATWIWLGAIIVFIGGLTALWPAPRGQTRRARAEYKARIARDLGSRARA
jgi:cytochrome c-type biogenesis protein CcmF